MSQQPDPRPWELMATPTRLGVTVGKEYLGRPYVVYPWTSYVERRVLAAIVDPEPRFIILNTPPQVGKTTFSGLLLPAWYLGMYPHHQVIFVAYAQEYAESWGLKARGLMDRYGRKLFGVGVSNQQSAAANWKTEQGFGGMMSVGIGGGITGNPGNCFPGDTLVSGPSGPRKMAEIARDGGIVWGYDHTSGKVVARPVSASKSSGRRPVVEIQFTSGRVIRCTDDHPIYIEGLGYTRAGLVEGGAKVRALCGGPVRRMRGRGDAPRLRARQEDPAGVEERLLQPDLHGEPLSPNDGPTVRLLRRAPRPDRRRREEEGSLLLAGLSTGSQRRQASHQGLPAVLGGVHPAAFARHLLLALMRGQGACAADARQGQLPLQDGRLLHEGVRRDAAPDPRAGRRLLRRLLEAIRPATRTSHPSHRREPAEQPAREPADALSGMPYDPPQVETDTVSLVRRLRGRGVEVFDIQVEGTNNFFAEGVLVHNCIIIDDVIKTMEEAASSTTKKKHLEEYDGAISSRFQEGDPETGEPGTTVLLTATRFSEDDLSGRLIERMDKEGYDGDRWEVISIPALAEPPEDVESDELEEWRDFLGRRAGEGLKCRFSQRFFEKRRSSIDAFAYSALYQQNPGLRQGGMFPRDLWAYWNASNLPGLPRVVRAWDLATTEGGGDWTVGTKMALGTNGDLYVLDRIRVQYGPSRVEDLVETTAQADGYDTLVLIEQEKAGAGKALVEHYQRKLAGYNVKPAKIEGAKEVRATPYSAMQNRQRVHLPEDAPWLEEWKAEHAKMMGDGRRPRHDDQIDTGAYCVLELIGQGVTEMWIPGEDPDDDSLSGLVMGGASRWG